MTIREKLEQLDYSDVFDLWSLWILQNAEPPDKWLIVHELSDLANMDADAAKELSDSIDKLLAKDNEDETSDKVKCPACEKEFPSDNVCTCGFSGKGIKIESPIIISVRGGCVYAVDGVPSDKYVEVRDYDTDGCEDDNIKYDADGDEYILSIY